GELAAQDAPFVALERHLRLAARAVPNLRRLIAAGGQYMLTIGRIRCRKYPCRVTVECDACWLARCDAPDQGRPVVASRQQLAPVGRELHGVDVANVDTLD